MSNRLNQAEERISECKGMSRERTHPDLFPQIKRMKHDVPRHLRVSFSLSESEYIFKLQVFLKKRERGKGLENEFNEITAFKVTEFWERCRQSGPGSSMDPEVF